jgi:hypothetical protein
MPAGPTIALSFSKGLSMLATLAMMLISLSVASGGPDLPADSMRVMRFTKGEAFPLPGVGAIIVQDGSSLRVQFIPPSERRPEKYRAVDLQADDRILMLNEIRVKTIAEFEKRHEAIAVGGEIKLGIQRGQEFMIATYLKPDPKDLPQMQMRIVKAGEGGEDTEVLPAVGVILTAKGKKVVISALIEPATSAVRDLDVKEGDVITTINGKTVTSLRSFVSVFDKTAVGSKVEWVADRKGKSVTVSFPRPKPLGGMIMRRERQ